MLGQDPKRLVISKIVQVNFKSYAGTIEIGPFHKSFTSVVGPNGSGKSNVIDSLLFVFGFKAKKLRQSKLSDLIHNSSAHPNLTSCQVQVHFEEIVDREDGYDVVPDSHFVVSRTVEKKVVMDKVSDKSTYFVNGVATTYTDVQTLLKGYGVDLDHKRFLILQGEVESIALMKPKGQGEHEDGLLEYLEDIIGTATLKEPIQHAEIKLQELMDRKDEKLEHLKLIQKETKSLEVFIFYLGAE
jgi:structural maintenance of chromosome 4